MFCLVWLFIIPRTIVCQLPLSKELSRPKYWRRLTFLSQGDLSDPGIVPASFASPASLALAGTFFTIWVTGEAQNYRLRHLNSNYNVPQITHKFVTEIIKINALLFKNKQWWTLGCTCLFQIWFPQWVCPEVGLLGHMAVLFPVF